jgi:hypothetical protein
MSTSLSSRKEQRQNSITSSGLMVNLSSKDGFPQLMGKEYPKFTEDLVLPGDDLRNLIRPQYWLNVPAQVQEAFMNHIDYTQVQTEMIL